MSAPYQVSDFQRACPHARLSTNAGTLRDTKCSRCGLPLAEIRRLEGRGAA